MQHQTTSPWRPIAASPQRTARRSVGVAALYAVAIVIAAAGCENEVETTANKLNTGATDVVTGDASGGSCDCLKKGMAFRFDKLTLDSIDKGDHSVRIVLNPLWKRDIDNFELNFFAEILDVSATEVKVRIVNGARVAGSVSDVCLLPYTSAEVIFPRDGCGLSPSAPTPMNVYAGTPATPKNCAPAIDVPHSIPVRGAVLEALVAADCSRIDNGFVSAGHLPKGALSKTCTCITTPKENSEDCGAPDPTFVDGTKDGTNPGCDGCNARFKNLEAQLNALGQLEYKCKEGDEPAACMTASFSGAKVEGLPAVCAGF